MDTGHTHSLSQALKTSLTLTHRKVSPVRESGGEVVSGVEDGGVVRGERILPLSLHHLQETHSEVVKEI